MTKQFGDYSNFDIEAYLNEKGIDYITEGKNVTEGSIEINCPFCGNDPSYHCGVFLSTKTFSCWRCGERGTALKLVAELEGYTGRDKWKNAFLILSKHTDRIIRSDDYYPDLPTDTRQLILPEPRIPLSPVAKNYLSSRGFDPDYLITRYRLECTDHTGTIPNVEGEDTEFKFRIFAPVYYKKRTLAYTGLDFTKMQKEKYKHSPNKCSMEPIKNCLYNLDSVTDRMIIMEGVTDVWRWGDECVALFGKNPSKRQIETMILTGVEKAVVMLDSDAKKEGRKLAETLSAFIPNINQITLSEGDPADFSYQDVKELKHKIFKGEI